MPQNFSKQIIKLVLYAEDYKNINPFKIVSIPAYNLTVFDIL